MGFQRCNQGILSDESTILRMVRGILRMVGAILRLASPIIKQ